MTFDYTRQVDRFFQKPGVTVDPKFGVEIQRLPAGHLAWRVWGIYHLTPEENKGKHNLFMEVRTADKQRPLRPAVIRWGWAGQRQDETTVPIVADKPLYEPSANIAIYPGQKVWAQVTDGTFASEAVANVHTAHEDEPGGWNTRFHHSFFVLWVLAHQTFITDPTPEPPKPPAEAVMEILVGGQSIYIGKPNHIEVLYRQDSSFLKNLWAKVVGND